MRKQVLLFKGLVKMSVSVVESVNEVFETSAPDLEIQGIIQRIAETKKITTMLSGSVQIDGKEGSWRKSLTDELNQLGIEAMNPEEEYANEENRLFREGLNNAMEDGDLAWIRKHGGEQMVMRNLERIVKCTFVTVYIEKRIIDAELERIHKIKSIKQRKKELLKSMHEICGTYGEITLAKFLGKPVYVVTDRSLAPCELHAWSVACSDWVFDNFNQYLRFVKTKYVDRN